MGDGDTGQRGRVASGEPRVRPHGLGARRIRGAGDEGVEIAAEPLDTGQEVVGQFDCGKFPGPEGFRQLRNGCVVQH